MSLTGKTFVVAVVIVVGPLLAWSRHSNAINLPRNHLDWQCKCFLYFEYVYFICFCQFTTNNESNCTYRSPTMEKLNLFFFSQPHWTVAYFTLLVIQSFTYVEFWYTCTVLKSPFIHFLCIFSMADCNYDGTVVQWSVVTQLCGLITRRSSWVSWFFPTVQHTRLTWLTTCIWQIAL